MNKKFIVWQLKRWIVPLAIFLGVIVLMFGLSVISIVTTFDGGAIYQIESGNSISTLSLLQTPIFVAILLAAIFPIVVFSYKFGMQRCDFYNQLPFRPKEFKRTIMILGLVAILAVIIVGYGLGASIFAIFYALSPATKTINYFGFVIEGATKINLDWTAIFYGLLYLIVICAASYFISSCIVYNNIGVFESIICIVLFHIAASSAVMVVQTRLVIHEIIESYDAISFGIIPMIAYSSMFDSLLTEGNIEVGKEFYISCGIYIALAAGGFIWTWLEKDRSAEVDNTKGEPKAFPIIVLHAGMLFGTGLIAALILQLGLPVLGLVMWALCMVVYFFLNVLYKHGFGLEMKQWLPMIPIVAATFALCFF